MSVHRIFGLLGTLTAVLVMPLVGQGRVPVPLQPTGSSVIPRRAVISDSLLPAADTVAARLQRPPASARMGSPIPGVVFAGDASLEGRGLAGPALNGVTAIVPLPMVLGHVTPFISGGATGPRWATPTAPLIRNDSIGALPLVLERSGLMDQLTDRDFRRFFGFGLAVQARSLALSTEIRQVHIRRNESRTELIIRGRLPLKLPF
jgi:hypothetical protein